MTGCRIALFAYCTLWVASVAIAGPPATRLVWKNGDELAGRVVRATADEIVWHSDALAQPVTLDLSVLTGILGPPKPESVADKKVEPDASAIGSLLRGGTKVWQAIAEGQPDATTLNQLIPKETIPDEAGMRIVLSDGMRLRGVLQAVTPTQVFFDSTRHGELKIDRAWIDRLQREAPGGIVDLIGGNLANWQSVDPRWRSKQPRLADWQITEREQIATSMPGGRLFLETELPEFCDIELSVQSSARPAFSLALGSLEHLQRRTGNLEIETWGDELVVASVDAEQPIPFESLGTIDKAATTLTLRIFWNRTNGSVTVHGGRAGRVFAESFAIAPDISDGGILLECKGADLTVTRLLVNHWRSDRPPRMIARQTRLMTMQGNDYYGTLAVGDDADPDQNAPDGKGHIEITSTEGEVVRVAPHDVAEIVMSHEAPPPRAAHNCELSFHDGAQLRGKLVGIEDNVATLETGFSKTPVTCRLEGLASCRFVTDQPGEPPTSEHVLEDAGLSLRGTLAEAGDRLGWQLVGARTAIPLNLNDDDDHNTVTIRRVKAPPVDSSRDDAPADQTHRDTVVLRSGDQLPCRVDTIDEHFVTLSTAISDVARIPQSDVQAVVLAAKHFTTVTGFDDPQWQFQQANPGNPQVLERHPDKLIFKNQAMVSHPTLLSGGTLEFDLNWTPTVQTYLMITLPQAPKEMEQDGNAPMFGMIRAQNEPMFYLMCQQNQVQVFVRDGMNFRAVNQQRARKGDEPLHVKVQVVDNQALIFVNDQECGTMQLPEDGSHPLGVRFHAQQLRMVNGQPAADLALTISNLKAGGGGSVFRNLPIDSDARQHVLTVPRMRRDRPPSHVLIGRNGDLLRGKLLSLGPTSARFQSRLDEIVIPRDRLSGIVWPHVAETDADETSAAKADPPQQAASASADALVHATFTNGVVMQFTPQGIKGDALLAEHPVLGTCRLTLSALDELRIGPPDEMQTQTAAPSFTEWTLVHAAEPVVPGGESGDFGTFSKLVGEPAEDFTLPLLDGGRFRLSEQRGKVVVLDFWATWCGPCIGAMPQLMAATAAFGDDVKFVAVNQDEDAKAIRKFLTAREWELTVGLDAGSEVGRMYQVQGIPQTVVIDGDGTIRHVHLGASPDLEASLTTVLEELVSGSTDAETVK